MKNEDAPWYGYIGVPEKFFEAGNNEPIDFPQDSFYAVYLNSDLEVFDWVEEENEVIKGKAMPKGSISRYKGNPIWESI